MRPVLMTLAMVLVLAGTTGCIVASSTQHCCAGKSVVVWDGELYVVNIRTRKAHRVQIEPRAELNGETDGETTETVIIEDESQTAAPPADRAPAMSPQDAGPRRESLGETLTGHCIWPSMAALWSRDSARWNCCTCGFANWRRWPGPRT